MIQIENISKVFRTSEVETVALNHVNLEVKEGELLREVFGTVADVHPFQNIFYHSATFGRF